MIAPPRLLRREIIVAHVMTLLCAGATLARKQGLFPADEQPLTASSLAKAKAVVLDLRPCRVWNGPDRASRQTAEAVGLVSVTEPVLGDMNYGQWACRKIRDVAEREPGRFHDWLGGAPPPDGDGLEEMSVRIRRWLFERVHHSGHTMAIVSPNVMRTCVLVALGVSPSDFFRLDVPPLTLGTLTSDGQIWRVRSLGVRPRRRDGG